MVWKSVKSLPISEELNPTDWPAANTCLPNCVASPVGSLVYPCLVLSCLGTLALSPLAPFPPIAWLPSPSYSPGCLALPSSPPPLPPRLHFAKDALLPFMILMFPSLVHISTSVSRPNSALCKILRCKSFNFKQTEWAYFG